MTWNESLFGKFPIIILKLFFAFWLKINSFDFKIVRSSLVYWKKKSENARNHKPKKRVQLKWKVINVTIFRGKSNFNRKPGRNHVTTKLLVPVDCPRPEFNGKFFSDPYHSLKCQKVANFSKNHQSCLIPKTSCFRLKFVQRGKKWFLIDWQQYFFILMYSRRFGGLKRGEK